MTIEEEIADEIAGIVTGDGYYATTIGIDAAREAVEAITPLLNRVRAEGAAEALESVADEIKSTFADPDRRRPKHPKAEVATDYVNDAQWAELIVRNRAEAQAIEQNSGGNEA